MAARTNKIRHNQDTRDKIKAGGIIRRLMDHIESDEPLMDASQVSAAKALLNKVLPDLRAVELSGSVDVALADRFARAEKRMKDNDD